jgi:flotillin
MAKKTSFIEMESRTEVAENTKKARTAEIESQQVIDVRAQEAAEAVGQRTAEKDKAVGIAEQQSRQEVLTQEKLTKERMMDVRRVEEVKQEEIEKDRQLVVADQDKQTRIIRAEGELQAQQKEAEAIRVVGVANADAEKAMKLAPVMAQIELAKEIGANEGYQQYLAMLEAIKAHIIVGQEQAQALQAADVKVIANAGSANEGMKRAMDLFSSQGGTNLAAMVEAFAQTPLGTAVLGQMGVKAGKVEAAKEEGSGLNGQDQ